MMKTIKLISLLFLFLPGFVMAQQNKDQNPRAEEAYQAYEQQLDGHANSMNATIDLTYVAYDPILEKERKREERREFRRQLRLERARNRFIFPYNRPYGFFRWPYPTW